MKKLLLAWVSSLLIGAPAFAQTDGYTLLCDSNGVALPGFYFPATNVTGVVGAAQLPTNVVYAAQLTAATNSTATNAAFQLLSVSNALAALNLAGTNWVFTSLNTQIAAASNALTAAGGAPALAVSNFLATNFSATILATSNSLFTSVTNATNSLSTAWNYNLNLASNGLQAQLTANTNLIWAVSNNVVTASNSLASYTTAVSNQVAGIVASKAFTVTVPANYDTIGVAFSAPLMPGANYSVELLPQDQSTATAPAAGIFWWVAPYTKTVNGFTVNTSYATNAYNLNFDCIVHYNTQ